MATKAKHAERSKRANRNESAKKAFFNECTFYANLRAKAKEKRKEKNNG